MDMPGLVATDERPKRLLEAHLAEDIRTGASSMYLMMAKVEHGGRARHGG